MSESCHEGLRRIRYRQELHAPPVSGSSKVAIGLGASAGPSALHTKIFGPGWRKTLAERSMKMERVIAFECEAHFRGNRQARSCSPARDQPGQNNPIFSVAC